MEQKGYHSVTAAYLSDIFSVADVENRSIVRLLSDTVWLTIFVTVIMMACLQTVTVLNHRRMLGIWYSSGVSRAQAVGVFAVAMILATIIALFIAGMVGLIWLRTFDKESAQSVRLIVRTRVVPHVIFSVVAMDLIGFLLPLHAVLNGKPARLMREFRT